MSTVIAFSRVSGGNWYKIDLPPPVTCDVISEAKQRASRQCDCSHACTRLTCRQNGQAVLSLQGGPDSLKLQRPKTLMPPVLLQQGLQLLLNFSHGFWILHYFEALLVFGKVATGSV